MTHKLAYRDTLYHFSTQLISAFCQTCQTCQNQILVPMAWALNMAQIHRTTADVTYQEFVHVFKGYMTQRQIQNYWRILRARYSHIKNTFSADEKTKVSIQYRNFLVKYFDIQAKTSQHPNQGLVVDNVLHLDCAWTGFSSCKMVFYASALEAYVHRHFNLKQTITRQLSAISHTVMARYQVIAGLQILELDDPQHVDFAWGFMLPTLDFRGLVNVELVAKHDVLTRISDFRLRLCHITLPEIRQSSSVSAQELLTRMGFKNVFTSKANMSQHMPSGCHLSGGEYRVKVDFYAADADTSLDDMSHNVTFRFEACHAFIYYHRHIATNSLCLIAKFTL